MSPRRMLSAKNSRLGGHFAKTTLSIAALACAMPAVAGGTGQPLSVRNSFRIGSSGVTCTAQNAPLDKRLGGIFDRG